jgi:hypothetical protein
MSYYPNKLEFLISVTLVLVALALAGHDQLQDETKTAEVIADIHARHAKQMELQEQPSIDEIQLALNVTRQP